MSFVPIEFGDYVDLFLENNPGSDRSEVTSRLETTLAAARAGALCRCGAPIWVIGSAEVGHMCFTCITGEAVPTEDYELADACGHHDLRPPRDQTSGR